MTKLAGLVVKNIRGFKKALEAEEKQCKKAAETAVKVEGYRLKNVLQYEIKAGAPGGEKFDPLSEIARRMRRPMNRMPLKRLSIPIRYAAKFVGGKFQAEVGFVDPSRGKKLSKSWKRIAELQQAGFTRPMIKERRLAIIRTAGRMGKRARGRQKLFLLKATTQFKTPARPIIDPFWAAHKTEAQRNIERNFERKMAGKRI